MTIIRNVHQWPAFLKKKNKKNKKQKKQKGKEKEKTKN